MKPASTVQFHIFMNARVLPGTLFSTHSRPQISYECTKYSQSADTSAIPPYFMLRFIYFHVLFSRNQSIAMVSPREAWWFFCFFPTDTNEERVREEQKPRQTCDRAIRHLLPGPSNSHLHRQGLQILLPILLSHPERRLLEHLPVKRETDEGGNEDRWIISNRSILLAYLEVKRLDCGFLYARNGRRMEMEISFTRINILLYVYFIYLSVLRCVWIFLKPSNFLHVHVKIRDLRMIKHWHFESYKNENTLLHETNRYLRLRNLAWIVRLGAVSN